MSTTCLDIPYEMRTDAKKYKCFYKPDEKLWSCNYSDDDDHDKINFINYYQQVYLNVPYDDKEIVKSHGGRWDAKCKTWFTYKGNEELKKYM